MSEYWLSVITADTEGLLDAVNGTEWYDAMLKHMTRIDECEGVDILSMQVRSIADLLVLETISNVICSIVTTYAFTREGKIWVSTADGCRPLVSFRERLLLDNKRYMVGSNILPPYLVICNLIECEFERGDYNE